MMAVWLTDAEYGRTPSTTKRISGDIREMLRSLEPVTRGGYYMGETDLTASPTRARDSLTPDVWERLHIGQA